MSAVRLYFDVDSMERGLLVALRAWGVDAVTALEAGMTAATDEEQLEFARLQTRVLVSFNGSDFCRNSLQAGVPNNFLKAISTLGSMPGTMGSRDSVLGLSDWIRRSRTAGSLLWDESQFDAANPQEKPLVERD